MASIQVVTDSACDLMPTTAEERDIRVVPLTIRFGAEELVDREELSSKEFWDRVITGPDMPATAAPSPGTFQEAFLAAHSAGKSGVVCVTISSGLSATYQAARTAADAVSDRIPVRVIDTQSVSMGQGLLALAAAEMTSSGVSLDDAASAIEEMKGRTHVFGVVDSLDYLKRGGRIGGAAHLVGSLLSIKPVIEVREGVVEVESKQRTRSRSLQYLANKATEAGPLERLATANGVAPDFDDVLEMVRRVQPEHELVIGDLGPVVGAHTGPGSVEVSFITKPN
jgi:DegV family protein with EDD domain